MLCQQEVKEAKEVKLLDWGHVRLVDWMGSDLSIVRSARVSYDAAWRTGEDAGKDEKLIRRLMKDRHTSPFEAVVFTFDVKAPIFVFRQWHRHRTWSYNEASSRYTELTEEFYVPEVDQITTQSTNNKQMRTDQVCPQAAAMAETMRDHNTRAFAAYHALLAQGCPRELARCVLPVATYSKMFGSVNLLNLFRFLGQRSAPDAQYEIRVYSEAMLELIEPIVPVAVAAFKELWLEKSSAT